MSSIARRGGCAAVQELIELLRELVLLVEAVLTPHRALTSGDDAKKEADHKDDDAKNDAELA